MTYVHPKKQKEWKQKNRERYLAYKREWARKWRLRMGMKVINKPNIGGPRPPHIEKPNKVMMYSDYLKIEKKRRKMERKLFTGVTRQGIIMRYTKKHE